VPSDLDEVLQIAARLQHTHDSAISPQKLAAKCHAAEVMRRAVGDAATLLDVGAEPFYQHLLPGTVHTLQLPDDMHHLDLPGRFDGALAMHVLEHSPAPLLVLRNIWRALKPDGWLYAATPPPVEPFLSLPSHITVLTATGWVRLLGMAGFTVVEHTVGRFGYYRNAVEDRWLARR
jgi:SAM-dependent methyltransferase